MNVGSIGTSAVMSPAQVAKTSGSAGAAAVTAPKMSAGAAKTPSLVSISKSVRGMKLDVKG